MGVSLSGGGTKAFAVKMGRPAGVTRLDAGGMG